MASNRLKYEKVAASQTAQVLGATGAAGDVITGVLVVPATTSPGVVTLLDGDVSISLYAGGTVGADLTPIYIPFNAKSVVGAWKLTTGANLSAVAFGDFR